MATTLNGKKIAFLVAPEAVERVELTEPWKAVVQTGGTPELEPTVLGNVVAECQDRSAQCGCQLGRR